MDLEAHLQSPKSKEKKKKHKVKYLEASIKMVKKNPQKNLPILGYTASGFDPFLNPESNNIGLYRHQEKEKRVELVVKPKGFEVDYVGTSYSGETAIGGMGGCGLLVLNKKTQLLNFVPVTANKTFRLLPLARASQISDKEPATPTIIETAEVKRQKEYELTVLYGTKDAKKKKNKAMKLRMNQDTGDAEEVDQIIEEEKMDNAALASSSSDITHDVPPHNLSATTPEEAYLLDKIILKGEWDYVNDVLELLQAGQELKPDIYPSFVRNRFHKLELSQDEAKKRKLAGILSYITHLVNFKNWNSLDGSSSSKHRKPPPRILSQKFTKMFIDSDKNRLADDKIGSLIGYVLVLTLFVDEFETDFTDISKDLKMSTLTIRPYLENLGCRFKRQKNVTFATLPVPLTFPTIRKKRRRGNK